MSARKRGPIKVDLTEPDAMSKLDVQWYPFIQKYVVKVRDGRNYRWSATQFAAYFRKWLICQREH